MSSSVRYEMPWASTGTRGPAWTPLSVALTSAKRRGGGEGEEEAEKKDVKPVSWSAEYRADNRPRTDPLPREPRYPGNTFRNNPLGRC